MSVTRRTFFQAIPGVLPLCRPSELPPMLSLTFEEWEQMDAILMAEALRNPARENMANKSSAILRQAVREVGPVNQGKR